MVELRLDVGLWRSLGARFHGMEEVVGSIPTRSTNIPFNTKHLQALHGRVQPRRGCGRVLKFFHFQRQHQFNDFQARFALLVIDSAGVNVECCAAAGVSHQFLSHLDVDPERSQIRRKRMTKTVPADALANDAFFGKRRPDALLQNAVGTEGLLSFMPDRGKKKIQFACIG
jgi:hypothetical protein